MNTPVERAMSYMWERYSDPLSLADIAHSAVLSRFHFSRVFKDVTGVTPGQFLVAIRIHQAKRLLMATSMNVAEVSVAVGYSSLGSFTNHFTDSVGLSPSMFRRMSDYGALECPAPQRTASLVDGEVTGTVSLPERYVTARVYLGVFDTRIVQHHPRAAGIVEITSALPCPYRLPNVLEGNCFVHAVAVGDSADPEPWNQRSVLIATCGPLRISRRTKTLVPVVLRPRHPADLPVLLALPDLEPEREYDPALSSWWNSSAR